MKREKPLAGRRILVTRARQQSAQFSSALKELGAEVIEFPTIEILPPRSWEKVDRAIDHLETYDWLIFTSANGVNFFWQRLKDRMKRFRFPSSLKVCAIGPATAKGLMEKGIPVHLMPKQFVAESILEGFQSMALAGKRILLVRVKKARDILPKGLRTMGARVDIVEAYRTIKPRGSTERLRRLLSEQEVDLLTFTSSSTVNHFVDLVGKENLEKFLKGVLIACIGPVTAQTARGWGMKVTIQPKHYTVPSLTRAIAAYFSKRRD